MAIDLHTHSTFSDGSRTPEELLHEASEAGLRAVALTDHDTTAGLERWRSAAADYPELMALDGVELSSRLGECELHFVGLGIIPGHPLLESYLAECREERIERARSMARKITSLGFPVDLEELAVSDWGSIGRPHFARLLVDKFGFASTGLVFDKYLKRGCPAYVPRQLPPPIRVIELIRNSGGVAIWAHPVVGANRNPRQVGKLVRKLQECGLDGFESYYSTYQVQDTERLRALAAELGMLESGGSDYHGDLFPNISIGKGGGALAVPDELLEGLLTTIGKRNLEIKAQL